jgi:hypothetical protein
MNAAATPTGRIVLRRSGEGLFVTTAAVEGEAIEVLLDTGAGPNLIDRTVAQRHRLVPQGVVTGTTQVGTVLSVDVAGPVRILAGGRRWIGPVGVIDFVARLEPASPTRGALSLAFFVGTAIDIDLGTGTLTIYEQGTAVDRGRGATCDLDLISIDGVSIEAFLRVSPVGQPGLRLLLDTGATTTSLSAAARAAFFGPNSANTPESLCRTSSYVTDRAVVHDGVLGADFFARNRVWLDLPNRIARLLPTSE